MRDSLPDGLDVEFTTHWPGPIDGREMDRVPPEGYGLFRWPIESDNRFWSRPLKKGEIGCAIGHLLCWRRALESSGERFLFLEDDTVFADRFSERLVDGLQRLDAHDPSWDLVYLGRHALGQDEPAFEGMVRPAFSYCTFAYLLSRRGLEKVLATGFEQALIPVDELLPALYLDHPRPDVRARYPKRLRAYAFEPPLVTDLPRDQAGTDTEDSDDAP
jgi:glycosyl transferase family 25